MHKNIYSQNLHIYFTDNSQNGVEKTIAICYNMN